MHFNRVIYQGKAVALKSYYITANYDMIHDTKQTCETRAPYGDYSLSVQSTQRMLSK